MSKDVGVNCCREIGNEEFINENIIEEEIMETVIERELPEQREGLTYSDYLQMIEAEEKVIEELDNEIEAVKSDLEDVEISIDLAEERQRLLLNKIKSVYSEVVNRRKDKEARLEELEKVLNERREYLRSLNYETPTLSEDEDELIDKQYKEVEQQEINEDSKSWFLDDWDEPQSEENNIYHIEDNTEYQEKVKEAVYFINDDDMAS